MPVLAQAELDVSLEAAKMDCVEALLLNNLLVLVAFSSSHVAFGTIRLEPTRYMERAWSRGWGSCDVGHRRGAATAAAAAPRSEWPGSKDLCLECHGLSGDTTKPRAVHRCQCFATQQSQAVVWHRYAALDLGLDLVQINSLVLRFIVSRTA